MKNDEQQHSGQEQESVAEHSAISGGRKVAGDVKEKSNSSPRKIEANRRNALKSTGPRTLNGKKRVSRNAARHGFFSKWLLIQGRDGRESQREYDSFCAGIHKHYQPLGWLEELWVEKIAVWSWRLRRLIRFESGQITLALARHSYELQQSRAEDLLEPESETSSNPEIDAMTDHLFLPEKEELDKLLRYEAMINKQLNHAIAELERVQARRKDGSPATKL